MCFWANVKALILRALVKLLVGYTVGFVRVVDDAIFVGEAAVVKKETTASNAVF